MGWCTSIGRRLEAQPIAIAAEKNVVLSHDFLLSYSLVTIVCCIMFLCSCASDKLRVVKLDWRMTFLDGFRYANDNLDGQVSHKSSLSRHTNSGILQFRSCGNGFNVSIKITWVNEMMRIFKREWYLEVDTKMHTTFGVLDRAVQKNAAHLICRQHNFPLGS